MAPEFKVVPPAVNEQDIREDDPVWFAVKAAALKAKDVGEKNPRAVVIAADTVVSVNGRIIGKPAGYNDAKEILKSLSGTQHKAITGIAVYRKADDKLLTDYELTYVKFNPITEQEIESYLANEDYMDKAGGYAIQREDDAFVEKIEGDYNNVVGLPVKKTRKLLKRFCLPEVETDIFDIAFPNKWAVGRIDGKVVFVPEGVYGDRVRVRIVRDTKNFSYGETVGIVDKSPFRTEPRCPYFGSCGGCAFQNTLYEKQTELKERYLLTTLNKIGGIDNPETLLMHPIIPSPDRFFYRNKMEFAFGLEKGETVIGLRERSLPFGRHKKNKIAPLGGCFIFSEAAEAIFPPVRQFAADAGLGPYDPYSGKGFFRHLVLREGKNTGEMMAVLVTRSSPSFDVTKFAEALTSSGANIKSLWWVENDRLSDAVCFEKKNHLLGDTWIEEKMGALRFRVGLQTFFQPNTKAADILYVKIKENIAELGGKKIAGMYCGSGAIEIYISGIAQQVEGVDIEPANIHTAVENCKINGISNCRFHAGSVEDVLKKGLLKDADVVIMDPPRAGISNRALKNILSLDAPAAIYVSCNPAAFARDANKMAAAGYALKKLYCADFFPHTPHLESMGVFVKA